jgi:hypothetical protein
MFLNFSTLIIGEWQTRYLFVLPGGLMIIQDDTYMLKIISFDSSYLVIIGSYSFKIATSDVIGICCADTIKFNRFFVI